jgi:hypothetical protein
MWNRYDKGEGPARVKGQRRGSTARNLDGWIKEKKQDRRQKVFGHQSVKTLVTQKGV